MVVIEWKATLGGSWLLRLGPQLSMESEAGGQKSIFEVLYSSKGKSTLGGRWLPRLGPQLGMEYKVFDHLIVAEPRIP